MKFFRSFLMVLGTLVFGIGCPAVPGPEPTNSVSIESQSSCTTLEDDIIAVEVTLSGSPNPPINLVAANDPIGPDEAQGFCCFADGVYDVTVRTGSDSATAFNNVFEGPATHSFLAQFSGGGCRGGNLDILRPFP